MIRFCDALLSERDDLAPAPIRQHEIRTGRIDPVWPNDVTGTGARRIEASVSAYANPARVSVTP
jgi:hypothetical protein